MNINSYDLYYTVIRNRGDKEIVNHKYEDNDVDYIIINEIFVPNHYVGSKNNNEILNR